MELHPERNMVKKWVIEKIKEVAERNGGAWVLRTAGSQPLQPLNPAAPTGRPHTLSVPCDAQLNPLNYQVEVNQKKSKMP